MAWHILRTYAEQERRVGEYLDSKGVIILSTLTKTVRPRKTIIEPFFPRYVLACVDLNDGDLLALVRGAKSRGLHSILEFCGKPAVVPISDIMLVQSRIGPDGFIVLDDQPDDDCGYRHGDAIEVTEAGPFTGYRGLFDRRLKKTDRIFVVLRGRGMCQEMKMEIGLDGIRHVFPEELQ